MSSMPWKILLAVFGLLALLILTTREQLWPVTRQTSAISKVAQLPATSNGEIQLGFVGENISTSLRVTLQPDLSNRHLVADTWKTWGQINDFALYGNHAYLVDREFGLLVIDVSDAGRMHLVQSVDLPEEGWKISIRDGLAVVAMPRYGVQFFDLSQPARPELLTSFPFEGVTHDVVVADHRVLVLSLPQGVQVIDAREPRHPKLLGHVDIPGRGSEIVVDGTRAAVACRSGGVALLDLAAGEMPKISSVLTTDFPAMSVAMRDNQLAVAFQYQHGFDLFEIRGNRVVTSQPGPKSFYARTLVLEQGRILVGSADGFRMFQTDHAQGIREIVHLETERTPFEIARDGARLFLLGRNMPLMKLNWDSLVDHGGEGIRKIYPDVFGIAEKEGRLFLSGKPFGLRIARRSGPHSWTTLADLGPAWRPSVVAASGDKALIAGRVGGLGLLRVDPTSGEVEEQWLDTNAISAMKIHAGQYALIAESRGRLGIFNLDQSLSSGIKWLPPLAGSVNSLDVNNSWVALSEEMVGIEIIGWDGVGKETSRQFLPFDIRIRQVRLQGDLLFVLSSSGALYRMTINSEGRLRERAHLNPGKPIGHMEMYDDRLYLVQNDGSISVLESGEDRSSKLVGKVFADNTPGMLRICAGNGRLYVSNYQGLFVYEVSKAGGLILIRHVENDSSIIDMSADSDLLWIVSRDRGLVLFERQERDAPTLRKQWQMQGREVVIVDQTALVRTNEGLLVVDIADPRRPRLIERRHVGWDVTGICRIDDVIVLVDKVMGMFVFQLTDERRLIEVATLPLPGKAWGAVVLEDMVLIPCGSEGLAIVRLADPEAPSLVTIEELPLPLASFATARGVAVHDRIAYVAQGRAGVQILQLDSTGFPTSASLFDTFYFARNVKVVGQRLFVADVFGGVLVYDLSDPLNPRFEDVVDVGHSARDLIPVGEEIWVPEPMRLIPKPMSLGLERSGREIVATVPGSLGEGWYNLRVMEPGVGVLWEGFLGKSAGRVELKTSGTFQ